MTCDAVGGVWQYANDLAHGLAGQGVEVVLAVLGPDSLSQREREQLTEGERKGEGEGGVTVISTDLPLDWLASAPGEVRRTAQAIASLAAEHGVDLVHLNSPALAAAASYPAPVIVVAHGCVGTWFAAQGEAVPPDLAWHERMTRAGLHAADVVIAPSAGYAVAVQRQYGLPFAPEVVHNGRAATPLPDAPPADHVLTAGRLWDRVKNAALLDATAALLPVPLRAAGPVTAPHGETLAATNLQLLGMLDADSLAAEYAAQPIFVSAARFEPFGLAVLEAAQAGCPLVLSGIDTFRELWTGAALIVPDEDAQAYAAAIERIRTELGLRAHLSEAARARAARYTAEAMTAGTLALYRSLLGAPERAAA